MRIFSPQYLVKSIADRVRLGLGLGLTQAQFRQDVVAQVRQDQHKAVGT